MNKIDAITAASVASVEVTEVYDRGTFTGKNKKIKFHDKLVALDKLARMIGVDAKQRKPEEVKPEPLTIIVKQSKVKIKKDNT